MVSEIDEMTRMEAEDIEAEIRQKHQPELHMGEPCPVHVCCTCGAQGCETGAVLGLLNMCRAALAAAQAEIAALRGARDAALKALVSCDPDCDTTYSEYAPCICYGDRTERAIALLDPAAGAERPGEGVSDGE